MTQKKEMKVIGFRIDEYSNLGKKVFVGDEKDVSHGICKYLTNSHNGRFYPIEPGHGDLRHCYVMLVDYDVAVKQRDINFLASTLAMQRVWGKALILRLVDGCMYSLRETDVRYLSRICDETFEN